MNYQKLLSGALAAVLCLGLLPASALASEEAMTRAEVRDALGHAAAPYHEGVTAGDILRGDGAGDLGEDRAATLGEALVMLDRAFGGLPAPTGANALNAYPAGSLTAVPAWAEEELRGLVTAGIVQGDATASVSAGELDTLIRRAYALEGTQLKDDFYAATNKQWLDAATIPAGQPVNGTLYGLMYKVNDDVRALITDIAAAEHKPGTGEEKIANLYNNVLDWDARNKAGIQPLKPYLDAIDAAKDLDDLLAADRMLQKELCGTLLLGFGLTVDLKDSSQYSVAFGTMGPSMTKDLYENGTEAQTAAYLTYLTTLAKLGGADDDEAARQAETVYQVEKTLAAAQLSPQERMDADKIYNVYSMKELKALFPKADLDALYAATGLKKTDKLVVGDVGLTQAAAGYFDGQHNDELKAMLRMGLLAGYGGALNKEFQEAGQAFNEAYIGTSGSQSDEEVAALQVQNLMSDYLGQAYVEQYFTAEAKADVEKMVGEFLDIYASRIRDLDWMSDETKALAVKKLEGMDVKVGYPDQWDTYMDKADIKGVAEGGSFFDNLVQITKVNYQQMLDYQGKPVDKSEWSTAAFTVNAFYDPTSNDITFPAGILQAPMYDVDAPREQNLGAIGYVIAHEITHAFDNNGAKFDEKGNAADWWTEADYAAFQALCDRAVAFYDGQESAPGITCNGALTLSENVADLGAAACITEAASREAEPDYETLFRSMSTTWRFAASRVYQEAIAGMDVHAQDKLRVNRVLQSLDQFYETFGIQPGDGMWVEPEARVRIW